MPKLVMGKDISSLTQEEKNALMAEMRSRRKNGNGRTGYKMPDAQKLATDNFEDPSKPRKIGEFAKFSNEHVKCIFVCSREIFPKDRAYGQTKIYYVGFLSDSNRFSFEEFRESPSKMVSGKFTGIQYRLNKYCQLFEKKNIDKDTDLIMCMDGIKESDFMFCIVKFMRAFAGCPFKKTSKVEIFKKLVREYGVYADSERAIKKADRYNQVSMNKELDNVHTFIFDNRLCPWINEKSKEDLKEYTKYKRHSRVLVELGLFYTVLLKFERMRRKSKTLG